MKLGPNSLGCRPVWRGLFAHSRPFPSIRSPFGDLMHDFCESDPAKMRDALMRRRVEYFKRTPEGVREMCRISEQIYNEDTDIRRGRKTPVRGQLQV